MLALGLLVLCWCFACEPGLRFVDFLFVLLELVVVSELMSAIFRLLDIFRFWSGQGAFTTIEDFSLHLQAHDIAKHPNMTGHVDLASPRSQA